MKREGTALAEREYFYEDYSDGAGIRYAVDEVVYRGRTAFQEVFIMDGKWADYEHVGMELGPVMNGLVLAGRYKDSDGREWSFTEQGQATFPEESFYYELSINDRKARCEYFEAEDLDAPEGMSYYGYAWKAGKLQLFRADMKNDRVQCEAEPFAVLTPH